MARAKQFTAANLKRLGVERLATILEEHADVDPALRRKLKLALSALEGGEKLAVSLEKRIRMIGRSQSSLDWEKGKELAKEIEHLRTTIAVTLAGQDARVAAERMWDLVGIADNVLARVHGSAQPAVEAFEAAIEDLGRLWSAVAGRQPMALARRVFAALQGDRALMELGLVQAIAPPLGPDGRAELWVPTSCGIGGARPSAATGRRSSRRSPTARVTWTLMPRRRGVVASRRCWRRVSPCA
jgi:hypothetical protein